MEKHLLNEKHEITTKTLLILFAAFFVPMLVIMLLSPPTSDDYLFLGQHFSGISDVVHYAIRYGNGRLFGNICGMYLVYHPVLAAFIKAFNITALSILLPKLLGAKHNATYFLSFLAAALTPPPDFFSNLQLDKRTF